MKPRYVYFIREAIGDLAPVKIGVATNIGKRIETLSCGNSRRLVLAAKIGPLTKAKAFDLEKKIHKKFSKFYIRGEWFSGVIFKNMHRLTECVEFIDEPEYTTYRKN